jgi:hypothetical protein
MSTILESASDQREGAQVGEGTRDANRAMAIAVRLDRRHDLDVGPGEPAHLGVVVA